MSKNTIVSELKALLNVNKGKSIEDILHEYNANHDPLSTLKFEIVEALPTEDIKTNVIYLVPNGSTGENVYDENIYIDNNWEIIGSTNIDLTQYALKSETYSREYIDDNLLPVVDKYETLILTGDVMTLHGYDPHFAVKGQHFYYNGSIYECTNIEIYHNDPPYVHEYEVDITFTRLEKTANKVTSLSENSTDDQYPSAKCVYDHALLYSAMNEYVFTWMSASSLALINSKDHSVVTLSKLLSFAQHKGFNFAIMPKVAVDDSGSYDTVFITNIAQSYETGDWTVTAMVAVNKSLKFFSGTFDSSSSPIKLAAV